MLNNCMGFTSFSMAEEITDTDLTSILETVYEEYGYDFRNYSRAHVKRRINNRLSIAGIHSGKEAAQRIRKDKVFATCFLQDLSITVTEMFRDPDFYRSLRERVIPVLRTYPFIKIWHAGCATGQEAYSMAILLQEEGLYDRTTIYATDFNQDALNQAKAGIFSSKLMKEYTANYQLAGGMESFADYYTSSYEMAIMNQNLKKNIVWANHNLVTDSVFAEVNLILCRNVMIYFDKELQKHVHDLFHASLIKGGILCLGSKESLRFGHHEDSYMEVDKEQKIYKKKY